MRPLSASPTFHAAADHPRQEARVRGERLDAQGAPRDPRRDSSGERSPWLPLETRPDSPGEPGMQPRDPCLPWRGTLRFLPDLKIRPSSIAANPVESQEASPSSIVSLTSQRHPEKLPEVTGTSRGNTGFPAATRERPRASFFQAPPGSQASSRGEAKDSALLSSRDAGLLEPRDHCLPWRGILGPGHTPR